MLVIRYENVCKLNGYFLLSLSSILSHVAWRSEWIDQQKVDLRGPVPQMKIEDSGFLKINEFVPYKGTISKGFKKSPNHWFSEAIYVSL